MCPQACQGNNDRPSALVLRGLRMCNFWGARETEGRVPPALLRLCRSCIRAVQELRTCRSFTSYDVSSARIRCLALARLLLFYWVLTRRAKV